MCPSRSPPSRPPPCVFPFDASAWRGPTQLLRMQRGVHVFPWVDAKLIDAKLDSRIAEMKPGKERKKMKDYVEFLITPVLVKEVGSTRCDGWTCYVKLYQKCWYCEECDYGIGYPYWRVRGGPKKRRA